MSLILPGEIIELKDGDVKVTEDFRKLPEQPLWGISSRAGVVQAKVRNEVTKIHLTSVGDSKYFPKKDDRVLGIISKRQGESYSVNIDADKEAV
jgi:exosome complex RNA-binding protein Rrp4